MLSCFRDREIGDCQPPDSRDRVLHFTGDHFRVVVLERADAGLYYGTAVEFGAALDYLLDHPDAARQLGAQGLAYIEREYRWPTVMRRIEPMLVVTITRGRCARI